MLLMIPIYYFICIFCPLYFTYKQDLIDSCGGGLSWYSYYVYLVFAITTFLIEFSLYSKILSTTSHLIPAAQITPSTTSFGNFFNEIKQMINKNRSYLYAFSLLSSQITRYNYFTDIGFIISCYQCQRLNIMYASIIFVGLHTLINLIYFILLVFQKSKRFLIPTSEIDKFYQMSTLLEFHAVSDTLDQISPSNVVVFPVFLRKISLFRLRVNQFKALYQIFSLKLLTKKRQQQGQLLMEEFTMQYKGFYLKILLSLQFRSYFLFQKTKQILALFFHLQQPYLLYQYHYISSFQLDHPQQISLILIT
ncbi:hypothetical protein ABPG74_004961 [Tetrahymena malaccensis]